AHRPGDRGPGSGAGTGRAGLAARRDQRRRVGVCGRRQRRDRGAGCAGAADRLRRRRRVDAARPRPRRASGRGRRRRARGTSDPDRVRAGHPVLVAVRPEGLDLGAAGRGHGQAGLVLRRADAGAEPGAGDAAHPVQQPGAVPAAAARGDGNHRAAADGRGHRVLRHGLDRGRHAAAVDGRRRRGVDHLAGAALCAADDGRGAGLGHRPGVRLQPGAAVDEGRDHELLAAVGVLRQPVGAADQRRGAQRGGHHPHRGNRDERDGVPDVLLRDLRVRRRGGVRLVRQAVSPAGPLPQLGPASHEETELPMNLSITLVIVVATGIVSWMAFNNRQLLDRLILWPPAVDRHKQYDRLVTHGFIHADLGHLLFNMITLFFFGRPVEQVFVERIGAAGFVLFYLSAIVVAILPTWLRHRHDAHYRSLGASGAVSAVLFAFILMAPWTGIYIFFIPIPIPAIIYAVVYVGYSIWMDRRGTDNVNHSAHLWGAGYGVLFALVMEPALFPHFLSALANPSLG